MRKFVCLLVVLVLMVSSTALADEILFRDIPWGSNASYTFQMLPEISFFDGFEQPLTRWGDQYVDAFEEKTGVLYMGIPLDETFKVSDYSVSVIQLEFAYGYADGNVLRDETDMELYSAMYLLTVADSKGAYDDLHIKMNRLYGDGKEEIRSTERSVVWSGENYTGAMLYVSQADTSFVVIKYGNTDVSALNELVQAIQSDKQADEIKNRTDNIDGL